MKNKMKNKMKNIILFIFMNIIIASSLLSQTVSTSSKLFIKHTDMTLYLQSDTNTMVSVHSLTYKNYMILISDKSVDRKDHWFDDTYKGKFNKKYYKNTNKDLGHLTPFKATSYSVETAKNSFS